MELTEKDNSIAKALGVFDRNTIYALNVFELLEGPAIVEAPVKIHRA